MGGIFWEVAEAVLVVGQSIGMPGWYVFAGTGGFGGLSGIASGMDSFSTKASGAFTTTPGSWAAVVSGLAASPEVGGAPW